MESKDRENSIRQRDEFTMKKKDFSIKSFLKVIKYSTEGFIHFYRFERSAILHLIISIALILGSFSLQLKAVEWLFMIFILLTMLAIELLNTAIEAVCDLVSPQYNKLIKIAKDSASAATASISIALVIALAIIYLPKLINMFGL